MVDESPPQGSVPEDVTGFIYGMSPVHTSISMSLLMASPSTTISPTSKELSMMWALWRVPAAGRPRLQERLDIVESTFGIFSFTTIHHTTPVLFSRTYPGMKSALWLRYG